MQPIALIHACRHRCTRKENVLGRGTYLTGGIHCKEAEERRSPPRETSSHTAIRGRGRQPYRPSTRSASSISTSNATSRHKTAQGAPEVHCRPGGVEVGWILPPKLPSKQYVEATGLSMHTDLRMSAELRPGDEEGSVELSILRADQHLVTLNLLASGERNCVPLPTRSPSLICFRHLGLPREPPILRICS